MCKKATCEICEKSTWWGCGNHIASVLDDVPEDKRCGCGPPVEFEGKKYPPKSGQKPDDA